MNKKVTYLIVDSIAITLLCTSNTVFFYCLVRCFKAYNDTMGFGGRTIAFVVRTGQK